MALAILTKNRFWFPMRVNNIQRTVVYAASTRAVRGVDHSIRLYAVHRGEYGSLHPVGRIVLPLLVTHAINEFRFQVRRVNRGGGLHREQEWDNCCENDHL